MKSSDVEAAVESLRVTEAQWYGELINGREKGGVVAGAFSWPEIRSGLASDRPDG